MSLSHNDPTQLRGPASSEAARTESTELDLYKSKSLLTLTQLESEPLCTEASHGRKEHPRSSIITKLSGWRGGVAANTIAVAFILLINLILLIIVATKPQGLIFKGSCDRAEWWMRTSHVAINVLSSIVLGASNYAMQILSAPTREEVDRTHERKEWLYIGTQALRNFRFISRSRIVLWVLLALSAIPFHIMYVISFTCGG